MEMLKMKDLTSTWIAYKKSSIKKTSLMQYERIINKYIDVYLGEKVLSEITIPVILDFIEEVNDNTLSAKSVQDIVVVLKSILRYGEVMRYTDIPIQAIPCPKANQEEVSVFKEEEVRILENYLSHNLNVRNMGILICLYTGIRLGEICALKWEDIELLERRIYIRKTLQRVSNKGKSHIQISNPKTKCSNRVVPISEELYQYLKEMKYKKESYILTGSEHYLDPRTYQYYFKRVLNRLDIRNCRFHTIRHTFASRCIQCNVDVKSLSEILGHASVNITLNRYVHSSFDIKKEQINKLQF